MGSLLTPFSWYDEIGQNPEDISEINHSYFRVFNTNGWNDSIHWTFFSQFDRDDPRLSHVEVFFLLLPVFLSLIENGVFIWLVFSNKQLRNVRNAYQASTAIASLLHIISAPMIAVGRISESWVAGDFGCRFSVYVPHLTSFVIAWNLVFISIDRYRKLCHPGKKQMDRNLTVISCVGIWVTGLIFLPQGIASTVTRVEYNGRTIAFCGIIFPYHTSFIASTVMFLLIVLLDYVVPLIVILYNYINILKHLYQVHKTHSKIILKPLSTPSLPAFNELQKNKLRKRNTHLIKLTITLLSLIFIYIAMWSPVIITICILQWESYGGKYRLKSSVFIGSLIVTYLNTCVNPFLYGYNDHKVRLAFKNKLKACCRWRRIAASVSVREMSELEDRITPIPTNNTAMKIDRKQGLTVLSDTDI